jgi:uncharacterized membrane protein YoaK (UPF0700 family)
MRTADSLPNNSSNPHHPHSAPNPMPTEHPPIEHEHRVAASLASAMLVASTGGALDAFIYLNHGHVFAAAMTGNGVLLGIAILHHDWVQAVRHLLPIFGFVLGVLAAKSLNHTLKDHAITIGLCCEISALFALSWLPGGFPDLAYISIIAVVGAYQLASFRQADSYAYNSTFMTGNLRTAVDGLFEAFQHDTHRAGLRKFRSLSLIVLGFLAGATAGAILSPRFLNHTLWFIEFPLITVLILRRQAASSLSKGKGEPDTPGTP